MSFSDKRMRIYDVSAGDRLSDWYAGEVALTSSGEIVAASDTSMFNALTSPTTFDHGSSAMMPMGLTGLTHGASLNPPAGSVAGDNGPEWNGSYVRGRSNYYDQGVQFTNGRGVYHRSQDISQWEPADTHQDLPTFAVHPPYVVGVRYRSLPMYSWPALNYHLKHKREWRQRFGALLDAAALVKTIKYLGVQLQKQGALKSGNALNHENNFCIGGRCRVPNLWLAQQFPRYIGEGCLCYGIWRRYRYHGEEAASPQAWNAGALVDTSAPFFDYDAMAAVDVDGDTEMSAFGLASNESDFQVSCEPRVRLASHLGADRELTEEEAAYGAEVRNLDLLEDWGSWRKGETGVRPVVRAPPLAERPASDAYYWQLDPWVSNDHNEPCTALYRGDPRGDPHNQFRGLPMCFGLVSHVMRGQNERTPQQVGYAREALYPVQRTEDYTRSLAKLDVLELMLGAAN